MDTLRSQIDSPTFTTKQAPLEQVQIRRIQVDISLLSIHRYLYIQDVDANRTTLTAKCDYQWKTFKDCQFLREPSLRETTKRWMVLHLFVDVEDDD